MSDITIEQGEQVPSTTTVRWKDMGDGTFALVASTVLLVGGDIVDATNPMPVENIIGAAAVAANNPFPVVLRDSAGNLLTVDDIICSLSVIPTQHHEVHEGETFQSSFYDNAVANNAIIGLLITVGADKELHLAFEVSGGGDFEIELIEAPTVTGPGTSILAANMRRASTNTSTATIAHTPTVTGATGTTLPNVLAPGGTGGNASGGGVRSNTEWVLKVSTAYYLVGTNRSGTTKPASLLVQWYEEDPPA